MTTQKTHVEQRVEQLREQFSIFEWILSVQAYPHDEYDVMVDLNTSFIEDTEEIHTLENHGIQIRAISDHGATGLRLYCDLQ